MSVTLHLGVLDVSYAGSNGSGATTTFQVAKILEANYGVMATFYRLRQEKIAGFLANSMAASIQRMIATGQKPDLRASLTYGADQRVETEFRQFLFSNELGRLYFAFAGKPLSAAAEAGVNHRKKNPYSKKNSPRPFAVDTGLYAASFRAWSTNDVNGQTTAVSS